MNNNGAAQRAFASRALSPLVPSPLRGGEGSMLCPRIRMGEGAFLQTPPHPSFSAQPLQSPFPPEGRGHHNNGRARGLSAQGGPLAYLHLTMSNSARFFIPAARSCALVVSFLSHPTRNRGAGGAPGRRTVYVVARVRRDARPAGRARLAALHRGGFGRCPRFQLQHYRRIR